MWPSAPAQFTAITLRNTTNRPRRVSLTGYCEWVLGENRDQNAMHVVTRLDPQSGAIFAQNAFSLDFADRLAFFHCSGEDRTLTADRTEFIGRNGSLDAPAALRREHLSNRVGAGLDPCAAIQGFGPPASRSGGVQSGRRAHGAGPAAGCATGRSSGARRAAEEVWTFWQHQLGGIYVEAIPPSISWSTTGCSPESVLALLRRTGFYQSANHGSRPVLVPGVPPRVSVAHPRTPAVVRLPPVRDGDVQHWWHPPSAAAYTASPTALWLPFACATTWRDRATTGILDETRPFLDAASPNRNRYGRVTGDIAHSTASAVRHAPCGRHGLPLIGSGDWNDGMTRQPQAGEKASLVSSAAGPARFGRAQTQQSARHLQRAETLATSSTC